MKQDISDILHAWEFNPEANVRNFMGDDGIPKLQVRVDQGAFQGILQLNLDGRPDGKRPYGEAFALDYFRRLQGVEEGAGAKKVHFSLDRQACGELFDESSRMYARYVFLLQLKDYDRVIRDTEHNMAIFRFVNEYAEHAEDQVNLEKWWPYILRINAVAQVLQAADAQEYDRALALVAQAQERLAQLTEVEAEEFHVERQRSQEALDELAKQLRGQKPLSRREILEQRLQEAIEHDAFERAATIRDELKKLAAAVPEANEIG